ncbi:MAG: hypothetical protein EU539_04290 [Promethearchaeota archaeon]|nr:MAG: hypothetical protein EU539_04290 [Candidatus Lokiarchaeota archaeon]
MPTLRIYYNAYFDAEIQQLEMEISNNLKIPQKKKPNMFSGFYKNDKIFHLLYQNYYIANYIELGTKLIPTINSELAYFNLVDQDFKSIKHAFPFIIKLIINKEEGIICFYSKQIIKNKEANKLVRKLHREHGFNFKYSLMNNHHVFKKNELNKLLDNLDISDFTEISVFDADNELIVKNSHALTRTKKVIPFIDELYSGNWSHVRLLNSNLGFEIRLSNNKTQNYLTFENDYVSDIHLVKVIDHLVKRIKKADTLTISERKKQTCIDYFQ